MNAVVTIQIGADYRRIAEITHPLMAVYAKRIGADFVSITEPAIGGPLHAEKFQLQSLLERYERVLFLDVDLLILPSCPDLFQIVPEDHFGAFDVSSFTRLHDRATRLIQDSLGNLGWVRPYFNSGVMVVSRCHSEVFNLQSPGRMADFNKVSGAEYYYDQTYINFMVQRLQIPLYDLGYRFNHTTAPGKSHERFRSHIIHYPGAGHRYGSKLKQISNDRRIIEHPALLELYRAYPYVTFASGQTRLPWPRLFR
jgi:hypothetical protein